MTSNITCSLTCGWNLKLFNRCGILLLTMLGHKSQEESKEERIIQKFGHGKCFGLKNCLLMRE